MAKVSYDSEELIDEVREDIFLFGESFKVYAIYSYFEDVDSEFITDYVDADKPEREETETEEEYQGLLRDFYGNLKSLEFTKNKKMTLKELLELLKEQNRII